MYFFEIKRPPPAKTPAELMERLYRRKYKWTVLLTNLYSSSRVKPRYHDDEDERIMVESYVQNSPEVRRIAFFLDLIA